MNKSARHSIKNTRLLVVLLLCGLQIRCDYETVERPAPEIESMQPTAGTKGTVVTFTGSGFSTNAQEIEVLFGGMKGEIITNDATSIVARVRGGSSTGNVQIKIRDKETQGPVFTYSEAGEAFPYAGSAFEGLENGDTLSARFTLPWGIDADANGNVYVADRGNHVIRKITPQGVVSTLAGSGFPGYADGNASEAEFNDPVDVAVDVAGNVYVSDFLNTCIRKINPAGVVSTYAGVAGEMGASNGTLTEARFAGPAGLAFDAGGNLYIADFFNHRIRKITPAGAVSTLAGSTAGCTNGTGAAAQFNAPLSIAVDGGANLYVTDGLNHSIRKITQAGVVTRIAGNCASGFADGAAGSAQFNSPVGIALDSDGNVIIADGGNNRIRKLYVSTNTVGTVAGKATAGNDFGVGPNASFNGPVDLVNLTGNTFLQVDFFNHRIVKVIID
jgi:hypothetical protein